MNSWKARLLKATWVSTAASLAAILTPTGVDFMPPAACATMAPEAQTDRVWFNRRSGVYHIHSCAYYTTTREGLFITLEEAKRIASPCGHCLAPTRRRSAKGERETVRGTIRAWLFP
jgi:hypothetical protein